MLNQFVVVGKLCEPIQIQSINGSNIKVGFLKLEVKRPYKNSNDEYDSDKLIIKINSNLAKALLLEVTIGCVVGVKGHLQQLDFYCELIADKISILSEKN